MLTIELEIVARERVLPTVRVTLLSTASIEKFPHRHTHRFDSRLF